MLKKILAILAMLCATVAMAAVDVNKASEAELDAVKGIGPGTSKLILTERKKGEFKDWSDFISRVKGVGEVRAAKLSEAGLIVGGTIYKPATTAAAGTKNEKKDATATAKDDKSVAKGAAVKEDKAAAKKDEKAAAKDDKTAAAAKPAASAAKK